MNKKHFAKRKKVVIDALDGKIINEPTAIKISNVEEYVEKNGFKLIKMLSIFIIFCLLNNSVSAEYDASYMTRLDITSTTNVHLLIFIICIAILLIVLGLKNNFYLLLLGCIILFFSGIILIVNGFNVLLSILIILISLILVWIGA